MKTKRKISASLIIIIILSLLLAGSVGYIICNKLINTSNPEQTNSDKDDNDGTEEKDETNNDTIEEEQESISYIFKEVNLTDTNITLGSNTYSLSVTENTNSFGHVIKVNSQTLDLGNDTKISNIYIWYDLLIIASSNGITDAVYAYDNALNSLGKISPDHYGWYTEGMLNTKNENKIQFSQEEITLFSKNLGPGGEIYSLNNKSIESITCQVAKAQYSTVPIQEKIIYKYENGQLSTPTKTPIKLLTDYICQ